MVILGWAYILLSAILNSSSICFLFFSRIWLDLPGRGWMGGAMSPFAGTPMVRRHFHGGPEY